MRGTGIRPVSASSTDRRLAGVHRAAAADAHEPVRVELRRQRGGLAHRLHRDMWAGRRRTPRRPEARRADAAPRRVATSIGRSMPASAQTSGSSESEPAPYRMILSGRSLLTPVAWAPSLRTAASAAARPCANSANASAIRLETRPVPRASEISRRPFMPATRASASAPAARSASTAAREMNVTPYPASTALRTDSCSPSSRRTSRSRSRMPRRRSSSSTMRRTPGALLHDHQRLRDELVHAHVAPGEAVRRRAHEHDLVVGERLVADSAVTRRSADDAELEPPLRDELDDRPGVVHLEGHAHSGMRLLELAEELRHDDRSRAGRGADRERAGQLALGFGGQLVEHLRLEREEPLRAPVQPAPRLRGLDPSPRAVEELRPQSLLQRPHLQRDRRLGDAELVRRLGERAALDHRAERRQLPRIHKKTLSERSRFPRPSALREDTRVLRVWIDVTNSPHVVFFRPLVELLRSRGNEVTISARDFAQTLELLDDAGLEHTVVGPPHGGASRISKIRAMGGRLRALRRFAGGAAVRHRVLARLARAASGGTFAGHSLGVRLRLRVRAPAARARLSGGDPCRRSRGDPAGSTRPAGRAFAEGPPVPGLKEEYYLHGFEPDERVLAGARARPFADPRGRADAPGGVALPPAREPALRRRARAPRQGSRRPRGRASANADAAGRAPGARAALARRARSARSTR